MRRHIGALALALGALAPAGAAAQAVTKDAPAPLPGPAVGTEAPDFALAGATRYGLLRDQIRLRDYRGQTVVLAFFFKARTKG
jgi:thioredoxin-dependent peroxiredoxin